MNPENIGSKEDAPRRVLNGPMKMVCPDMWIDVEFWPVIDKGNRYRVSVNGTYVGYWLESMKTWYEVGCGPRKFKDFVEAAWFAARNA